MTWINLLLYQRMTTVFDLKQKCYSFPNTLSKPVEPLQVHQKKSLIYVFKVLRRVSAYQQEDVDGANSNNGFRHDLCWVTRVYTNIRKLSHLREKIFQNIFICNMQITKFSSRSHQPEAKLRLDVIVYLLVRSLRKSAASTLTASSEVLALVITIARDYNKAGPFRNVACVTGFITCVSCLRAAKQTGI